jgi:hypothetical protein
MDPTRADRLVKLLDAVRESHASSSFDGIVERLHHHVLTDLRDGAITEEELRADLAALTAAGLLKKSVVLTADRWSFTGGAPDRSTGPQPWLRALVERVDTGEV